MSLSSFKLNSFEKGLLYCTLLIFSSLKASLGIPVLLVFTYLFLEKNPLEKENILVFILLLIKILWTLTAHFSYGTYSFYHILQLLAFDVFIMFMCFYRVDKDFITGIAVILLSVFFIEFSANIISILGIGTENYELGLKRLTGIFGHPYLTVNFATVIFVLGLFNGSKYLMFISIATLLLTQSLRGPLMACLIAFSVFGFYFRISRKLLYIGYVIFILIVFIAPYIYAQYYPEELGNQLRAVKWQSALSLIIQNPIFGIQHFQNGEFIESEFFNGSENIIYSLRNAESSFLNAALDFGIPYSMLSPIVFFLIARKKIINFFSQDKSQINFSIALISSIMFVDYFYGSFYGNIIPVSIFSLLAISFDSNSE